MARYLKISFGGGLVRVIWNGKAVVDMLGDIGLSQYEARMYFALLTLGKAKVTTLSKKAYVPQSKAYEVLESLIEKGFAEMSNDERPKTFRALALDKIAMMTMAKEEKFIKKLNKNFEALQNILQAISPVYEQYGAFGLFSPNFERRCKTWTKMSL